MRRYLIPYVLFCLIGTLLEWGYGAFWGLAGEAPWLYPHSPLSYTSFEVVPLWGLGGLICVLVYRAYAERNPGVLQGLIIPLGLTALYILVITRFL